MSKILIVFVFALFTCFNAIAQTKNSVYERYLDFNLARFEHSPEALNTGEALLDSAQYLNPNAQVSFYNGLAKLYEDDSQFEKAIIYYQKVVQAKPDYYVAQRALGYIYSKKANDIGEQLNASKGNKTLNDQLTAAYIVAAKKALPYLEKAQACDPSDETLDLIKMLYRNIKDQAGLAALPAHLKQLSGNCIDILTDQ